MGRTSLCWVLLLLLGSSCGTSRKTLVAPKAIPMKDEARVEELSNAKLPQSRLLRLKVLYCRKLRQSRPK